MEVMREKILSAIDKNSKLTAKDLAAMLGSTEEEVALTIKQLEEESIICGYPTLINWDKTESEKVTALIEVKVTPQRGQGFDKIAERIYKFDEVESVYLMSGGFDLTVIIEGKSMKEVATFVSSKLAPMEAVLSTATHFVLKKYKEHGLPLVQESKDERMLITP
jgi:DNA-binding Lrp family transcriptional regulator